MRTVSNIPSFQAGVAAVFIGRGYETSDLGPKHMSVQRVPVWTKLRRFASYSLIPGARYPAARISVNHALYFAYLVRRPFRHCRSCRRRRRYSQ